MVIAVVGSGGKTTLIHKLAKEYLDMGKRVFVTTSTHMGIEEDTLLSDDAEEIIRVLSEKGYVMAGVPEGIKIHTLSRDTYEKVCAHADVVLVEADGSARRPVKFPNATEPVIYDNTDRIIIVCNLMAIGSTFKESAFRLELIKAQLGVTEDTRITAEHIQKLIRVGYLQRLAKEYPDKELEVYPVHADTPEQCALAERIRENLDVNADMPGNEA